MISVIRLITIHPVFVHFTIGALPIMVLAYGLAAVLGSEQWSFAADVAAGVTAVLTVLTLVFGLVSNAYVGWPGGLDFWRWLHLGLGAGTTFLMLLLAGTRIMMRRRGRVVAGFGAFGAAILTSFVAGAAGWVGGEVLTYTAGMAVQAAGQGALSPVPSEERNPADLADAMGQLRGDWGAAISELSRMLVRHPTDSDFAGIARRAASLQRVAAWMAVNGSKTLPRPNAMVREEDHEHEHGHQPDGEPPPGPGAASQPSSPPATLLVHNHEEAGAGSEHEEHGGPHSRAEHLAEMSRILQQRAHTLQEAAERKDIVDVARAAGSVSEECADCHQELRWRAHD
jgi:uncharacterized membrane protein